MNNVIDMTQALVRIPSLPGNEQAASAFIHDLMRQAGFDEVAIDHNGSVIGLFGPKDADVALLFDGHMDVVPVVGNWTVDPFGGDIKEGRLYGRGSTDMKGGLAAALCGVIEAAQRHTLKKRVAVSASVLEEVIEGYALSSVLDAHQPQNVVICEPSKLNIKAAQKGRAEILLTLRGKPAHAANPDVGINPMYAAAHALLALQQLTLPRSDRLGPAILVPTDMVTTPYPSISMIPTSVTIRFDRRLLVGETQEGVLAEIQSCLQAAKVSDFSVAISQDQVHTFTGIAASPERWLPAWQTDEDTPLLQATQAAVATAGLETSIGAWPFCTNGSESAGKRHIPTVGIGPGNEEDAHIIDESIAVAQLLQAKDIYAQMVVSLCT